MKTCPFCGEKINNNAQKCRYCGEWVEYEAKSNNSKLFFNPYILTVFIILTFCALFLCILDYKAIEAVGLYYVYVLILSWLYFLPTSFAYKKNHPQIISIFFINLLFGSTGLGWICAMVLACNYRTGRKTHI